MGGRKNFEPATMLYKIAQLPSWKHEVVRPGHVFFSADAQIAPKHVLRIRNLNSITLDNIYTCLPANYKKELLVPASGGWKSWISSKLPEESPVRQERTIDYYKLISYIHDNQSKIDLCEQEISRFCRDHIKDDLEFHQLYPPDASHRSEEGESGIVGVLRAVSKLATG